MRLERLNSGAASNCGIAWPRSMRCTRYRLPPASSRHTRRRTSARGQRPVVFTAAQKDTPRPVIQQELCVIRPAPVGVAPRHTIRLLARFPPVMVRDDKSGLVPTPPSRPNRTGDELDVLGGEARRAGTEQRIEPADCCEDLAPHGQVCADYPPRTHESAWLDRRRSVHIEDRKVRVGWVVTYDPPADNSNVVRLEYACERPEIIASGIAVVVCKGEDLAAGGRDRLVLRSAQGPRARMQRTDGKRCECRILPDYQVGVVVRGVVDEQ